MVKIMKKRMRMIYNDIRCNHAYDVFDAIYLLKKYCVSKFVESVDVAINLNIDTKKPEQNILGYSILPNGIGRNICVAVFADKEDVVLAKSFGADYVGMEDLLEKIEKKKIIFDILICSPSTLYMVNKVKHVLGPRNLLPNEKVGTISSDVGKSVQCAKSGKVIYRNDRNGIIHTTIGKICFDVNQIKENLDCLVNSLKKFRSSYVRRRGIFIKKISLSTTMGGGICIDKNTLKF
ncbi:MAG: 50S ribosomal subunit protein L1 [Candidatus Westeberhardia cardiocondylae]|nr:50S ribosomal subunit protein L1 [Candidatus Westeberhardia cardiocondylae]